MARAHRFLVVVLPFSLIALSATISLGQNPVELRVTAPSRMLNDKTLTLKAELFDGSGNIDWQVWSAYGTVSAMRVADQSPVPITITYFEEHAGIPAPDSIRFYNGKGSVSFTLDNGLCEPPGEIEVIVSVLGVTGSKIVTVLDDTPMRTLSGNISGNKNWSPGDGVIHLTGNVSWDSGDLVIQPGTLVMLDPSVDFDLSSGRRIMAQGTEEDPIYFFPTTGPPGMVLPNVCSSGSPSCEGGTRHNPEAWGQIRHSGSASSVFEHVFFVGAGNGGSEGHTRPPVLRFVNSSGFELNDCVLADNPGKAVYGSGNGTYIFQRTLITRCGHGTEFTGGSGYTLRILNTWYAGVGRGPGRDRCGNDCGFDGDLINPRSPGDILIKGCILTDGGDEAIDGSVATITVEDTIMYNVRDRAYTDDSSSARATFDNCLIFGNGGALGGSGKKIIVNSTLYGGGGVGGSINEIRQSILWPQTLNGCPGSPIEYNILGPGSTVNCDPSNQNVDPEFIRTSGPNYNFDLQPTSPAIVAGPGSNRVGWLGFPTGASCFTDPDCDDSDPCTLDTCSSGACRNDTIVGCVTCSVDADCDRDPQCVGTCAAGICVYGGSCDDGLSCTSSDTCVGGFCAGEDDCPEGRECNRAADACVLVPTTLIFQQGVDGYSGTQDSYIFQEFPDQSYGDSDLVEWDGQESTSPAGLGEIVGLIRFEEIFGTGPGQIPVPGDEITSAVIEYFTDDVGDDGEVREAYVDWGEQITWGGFGPDPGPDAEDYGPILALAPGAPPGGGLSTSTVDVTPSIRRWADDPSQNTGWVLIPTGDNGSEFWSSEYSGDITARPKLVVIYGGEAPLPDVLRQPYLQKAAPTSMTIVWKTALATDSRVSFGTSPGVYDQTVLDATPTTDHEVTLTGLTPNTTYYYEVGSEERFHAGGCADHYFKTPPPIGTPAHFRTWAFSDSGIHSVYQYRVRDAILNRAGSHPPDVIIHTGDVDQGIPGADDYTVHHFDVYNEVLSHTPMYPTVGNHDGYTSHSSSGTGPYFDAFALPTAGECGGLASGTESYYSFDYANAHFVVLDSDGGNLEPDSPMLTWLESDLAATEQQWLIAYWHHPPYSFGDHNSNDGSDSGGRSRKMRETFVPVLEAGGVDLVFAGHSHLLERSFLISGAYGYGSDPNWATPSFATLLADGHIIDSGDGRTNGNGAYVKSPFLNAHEGTVYMTLSSGGETLDPEPSPWHPVMYNTKRYYGSALIDINGNELTLEWIREDGSRLDYFSIFKPCIDDTDCEDSRYCNGVATCESSNCVAGALPCSGQLCNEEMDTCVACLDDWDCDDGLFCNGAETCAINGVCEAGADPCAPGDTCNEVLDLCEQDECLIDEDCDDENPCTDEFCNAGTCEYSDNADLCDDGDLCTLDDRCIAGSCVGTPLVCDDGNVCTDDSCNAGACEYVANSVSCDDGDPCTQGDLCSGEVCSGALVDCSGLNDACNVGVCNPASGDCEAQPVPPGVGCDDGELCTINDQCDAGSCTGSPVDCSGLDDSCNIGVCNSATGLCEPEPANEAASCDDGDACTENDECNSGACVGSDVDCSHLNEACQVGVCNPGTGSCEPQPVGEGGPCNDGDPCTDDDVCSAGSCSGTALDCSAWDDACNVGVCNPAGGGCEAEPANEGGGCDDGDACTEADLCLGGVCGGTLVDCSSLNDACNVGACNPTDGSCEAQPANEGGGCDDGEACTEDDSCTGGTCGGTPVDCSSLNDACNIGVCNPTSGSCEAQPDNEGGGCDDGEACTEADSCSGGICGGTPVDCSGLSDVCNIGVCNPTSGSCEAQPANEGGGCDDGDACTEDDSCSGGSCGGTAVDCSGLNDACNVGICNPASGSCQAQPANEGGACDDGEACTEGDSCSAGVCSGSLVDCSGLNGPCTAGECNPATGQCEAQPINEAGSCDDGNDCTEDDRCLAGICGGTLVDCSGLDDTCNVGVCNPTGGSCETQPANEGGGCDDGQACTGNDSCTSGACIGTEACPPGEFCDPEGECAVPVELVFRNDGVYAGTRDTFIQESAAGSNHGAEDYWEWDSENGTPAGQNYGLIRFEEIIDGGPERIPPGARVLSAYLRLAVWDPSAAPPAEVRESLVDWSESGESWNTFGGEPGVQADELGNYVADAPISTGLVDVDVTTSVQAWAEGRSGNQGWIFVPRSTNGVHVRSAEYAVVAERPTLIVRVVGAGCDVDAECDDGVFCNGAEVCASGVCRYGSPVNCDDGLACTTDSCNESADLCNHAPIHSTCDDGNACTDDTCDPAVGCVFTNNTVVCDDGDACTEADLCLGGICGGTLVDCSSLNDACNVGVCNPINGSCEAEPANEGGGCDDGDACTEDDLCLGGICGGTLVDCSSLNDVCNVGVCNPTNGSCEAQPANEGGACDDGEACTDGDSCSAGVCGGTLVDCSSLNDACNVGVCNPTNGSCEAQPANEGGGCDDGDACTEGDACSSGNCNGALVDCSGLTDTCNVGVCNASTGSCEAQPTNEGGTCVDGDNCTEADSCSVGTCIGVPVDCSWVDDGCNVGACDPASGECQPHHTNEGGDCDDGDACTENDTCSTGACNGTPRDCSAWDDICNVGVCNPATSGCEPVPANEGGGCDDGDACTTADTCNTGICEGGPALICNDDNVCTDEVCDPAVGCLYTNSVLSCDDGDTCTEDDLCSDGTCIGIPVTLDEIENLTCHANAVMTWDDHGAGTLYDVAGGWLADLQLDGGVLNAECLQAGLDVPLFTDPRPDPSAGTGYYYILRSRSTCGAGSYGSTSAGSTRLLLNGCP